MVFDVPVKKIGRTSVRHYCGYNEAPVSTDDNEDQMRLPSRCLRLSSVDSVIHLDLSCQGCVAGSLTTTPTVALGLASELDKYPFGREG